MANENKEVSEVIPGLTATDPRVLNDFMNAMAEEAIPEILRAIEERKNLAAETRQWQIKC